MALLLSTSFICLYICIVFAAAPKIRGNVFFFIKNKIPQKMFLILGMMGEQISCNRKFVYILTL